MAVSRYDMVIDLIVLFQNVFFLTSWNIRIILALYFLSFMARYMTRRKIRKARMAIIYIDILTINEAVYPDDSIVYGRSFFSPPPVAASIRCYSFKPGFINPKIGSGLSIWNVTTSLTPLIKTSDVAGIDISYMDKYARI